MNKLVLVSVCYKGQRATAIVSVAMGPNGEAHIPMSILTRLAESLGWSQGETFSFY